MTNRAIASKIPHVAQVASLICLGLGILAFIPWSWLGFFLPKIILISTGLALFFFFTVKRKHLWNAKPLALLVAFAYFGLLLYSSIFSIAPLSSLLGVSGAMQGFQTHLIYFGIFVLAISITAKEESWLNKGIIGLNITVGIYALLQWLQLDPFAGFWDTDAFLNRTFSFIGNPNWLAAFIVLTMPIVLNFWQKSKDRPDKWLALIFEWLVLLSTGSRAGWLAGFVVTIFFICQNLKKKDHEQKTTNVFGIIAGIIVVVVYGLFVLQNFYPDSFAFTRTFESRKVIWSDTVTMLKSCPCWFGLDTFRFNYPNFTSPNLLKYEDITSTVDNPHNQFLQLLYDTGPLGVLLFYGLIFIVLKSHFTTKSEFLIGTGIIAYLLTNIFSFETITTGVIFWFLIGRLALNQTTTTLPISKIKTILIPASFIILGVSFTTTAALNFQHFLANFNYEEAWKLLQQGHTKPAIVALQKAIDQYPFDRVYHLQISEAIIASTPQQNNLDTEPPITNPLELAEQSLNQVNFLSSGKDPDEEILRAWLAAIQNKSEIAEKHFTEIIKNQPNNIRNYMIGIEIYKTLNEPAKVIKLKQMLQDLLPPYWNKPETNEGRIFQKNYPWLVEAVS